MRQLKNDELTVMGYINKKLGREKKEPKPKGPSWMSTALGGLKKYRESKKAKATEIDAVKEDEKAQKEFVGALNENAPKEGEQAPTPNTEVPVENTDDSSKHAELPEPTKKGISRMIPLAILNMFKKKPGKENDIKPILMNDV